MQKQMKRDKNLLWQNHFFRNTFLDLKNTEN